MDAFFASVEQRDRPSLKNKPVIVGGDPQSRAVVCAASYEARRFGVKSAMSCSEAKRRCPQGIFVQPRFDAYSEASDAIMEVLKTVTDQIEPLSLDEAYLDVTQNQFNEKSATRLAQHLKAEILKKTQLTASAGVSFNKFLAKIASDLKKPNGLVVITPQEMDAILLPLPVERLWGVGKKTAEKFHALQLKTVGDVRTVTEQVMIQQFGSSGSYFWNLANGRDDREVESGWDPKSCGTERTFAEDTLSIAKLVEVLGDLAAEIAETLRSRSWLALTFTLKIKYFDFRQITRSVTFSIPTDQASMIEQNLKAMLVEKTDAGRVPIRLLGVACSGLIRETDPLQFYFEFMNQ